MKNKKTVKDARLKDLDDDSYLNVLRSLIRVSFTQVSANSAKRGTSYRFTEEYNKEDKLLKLTVFSKAAGYKESAIQEIRMRAKDSSRGMRDVRRAIYEALLISLVETSLITWEQTALMLATDTKLQEAAKKV